MNAFFETTNGFNFQIIDPLIESRGVRLTWFDCKYNFTIKPVISCELDSHKYSNITKKLRGLNNDLRCPLAFWLDKTTISP